MEDLINKFWDDIYPYIEDIKTGTFYVFPFESIEISKGMAKVKIQNTIEITCHIEDCYILEYPTEYTPGKVKIFQLGDEDG